MATTTKVIAGFKVNKQSRERTEQMVERVQKELVALDNKLGHKAEKNSKVREVIDEQNQT